MVVYIFNIWDMNKNLFILWILVLFLSWCSLIVNNNDVSQSPNPASVFCEKNWWTLEIVPDSWWEWWKCNFEDGSFCEERAYYHWECSPNRWNWNTIELEDMQEMQNDENISQETKDEITNLVWEIQDHEEINNLWKNTENTVTCTTDVKKCDDWTYVSRVWEDCEFASCPWYVLDESAIQEKIKNYKSSWSELDESDIDLMNDIIDSVLQG